jgi:hypothetical protein
VNPVILALVFTIVLSLTPRQYLLSLLPVWLRPKKGSQALMDTLALLGVLCLLVFVAMTPEARLVFAAIDAIGLDVFVLLVLLQLRTLPSLLSQVRDWWYRRLGLPGYRLCLESVRALPEVAVYVILVPLCLIGVGAFIALKNV